MSDLKTLLAAASPLPLAAEYYDEDFHTILTAADQQIAEAYSVTAAQLIVRMVNAAPAVLELLDEIQIYRENLEAEGFQGINNLYDALVAALNT